MKIQTLFFDSLTSTNDVAKEQIHCFPKEEMIVFSAKQQTKGRGRDVHVWISPPVGNIYASLCLYLSSNLTAKAGQIGLVFLHTILNCVDNLEVDLQFKWPNDLLFAGKKVGGILGETVSSEEGGAWLILGIGLNVNVTQDLLNRYPFVSTSLLEARGSSIDEKELLLTIVNQFITAYQRFRKVGLSPFIEDLSQRSCFKKGEILSFETDLEVVVGNYLGLSQEGGLSLRLLNGKEKVFFSGRSVKIGDHFKERA